MMMRQPSYFWDKIAERYSKQPIADEDAYQEKLRITREYFRPDMEVLEFGCGTGSTATTHAPYVKHLLAIDISPKMLEIAQRKADASNVKNVTFQHSSIDEFSAPDQTFDVVLGLSILHLLGDKEAAIRKVHRMLKPGGIFVSSTPCLGDTMKFLKLIAPAGRLLGFFPLLKVFSKKELKASLIDGGFEIDHEWQPRKGKAVFIVAKKVG
jgi:ubiquinone/menaquinone biosynthesis C-methylase UbiE